MTSCPVSALDSLAAKEMGAGEKLTSPEVVADAVDVVFKLGLAGDLTEVGAGCGFGAGFVTGFETGF